MHKVRRLGIVRTANTVAVIYALVIAIFAIPFALIAAAAGGFETTTGRIGPVEVLTFAVIGLLLYSVLGWVFTAVACLIYNLAARWTGGVEIQLEAVAAPPAAPVWTGPAMTAPPTEATPPPAPPAPPPAT